MNIIQDWRAALISIVLFIIAGFFAVLAKSYLDKGADIDAIGASGVLTTLVFTIAVILFFHGFKG